MSARDDFPLEFPEDFTHYHAAMDEIDRLRLELNRWAPLNDKRNAIDGQRCDACGALVAPETEIWTIGVQTAHMNAHGSFCGPIRGDGEQGTTDG